MAGDKGQKDYIEIVAGQQAAISKLKKTLAEKDAEIKNLRDKIKELLTGSKPVHERI